MADLQIGRMVLGVCQTNCYYIGKEGSKDIILADPADRGNQIFETLETKGYRIAAILLTHGHFDHIWGANELRKLSGARIYAYEGEKQLCENAQLNVSAQAGKPETVTADVYVKDGETLEFAGMECKVIATPGHTAGSCCYYFKTAGILLSGDTLFEGSVGRTDFPTGSMGSLVRSVKERLLTLPEDVAVYPGHGEATTIGEEKRYNPYCQ